MEYQSMSRKELQSLCKKNGIPANTTNALMAQSLAALLSSSTMEHDQSAKERDTRSSELEAAKESDNAEKEAILTTPAVGNRRASTRKLPTSTCEKAAVRSTRKSASIMKEESDISDITQEQSLVKNKKEATQEREEDLKAESKGQTEEGYTAAEVSDGGVHQSSNETELGTAKQTRGRRGRAPSKATVVANSQKEGGIRSSRSKTPSKVAEVLVISDKEEAEAEATEEEEDDEKVGKVDIGMDFHTPASALRNNLLENSLMKAARKEESGAGDGILEVNLHTPAISRRDESKLSEVPTTNPSIRRSSRRVGGGVSVSNSAASSSSSIKQKQASVATSVRMSARRRRPTDSVDSCIPKNPSVSDNEGDVEDNCNEKASQKIANTDGRRRSARVKPPTNENEDSSTLKGSSERELAATIEKKTPYGRRITKASTKKGSVFTVSELKKSVKFALDTQERVPYEGDAVAVGNPTEEEALSSSKEVDTAIPSMASEEGCLDSTLVNASKEVDNVIPSTASVEESNGAPSEYDVVVEVNQMEKEASPSSKEVDAVIPSMISVEGLDSALVNEVGGESNGAPSKDNIAVAVVSLVEKEVLSSTNEVDTVIPSMASSAEEQFEGGNEEQFVPNEDLGPLKIEVDSDKSSLDCINKDSAVVNQREEEEEVEEVEEEEEKVAEIETAIPSMVEVVPDQMPSVLPSPFEGENEEQFVPNEELVQESDGKEGSAVAVGQIAMEEESLVNNSGTAIPSMVSCGLDASNGPIKGEMDEEQSAQLANDEAATAICPSIPSRRSEEQSEAMFEVPCHLEEKVETSIAFEAIEITEQIVLAEEEKGVENLAMFVTEEMNVETESKEVSLSKEGLSEALVEKEGNSEREKEMDYACLSLRKLRALCKQKGGRPLPSSTTQSNNAIAVKKPVENTTIPPSSSTEESITNIAIELPTVILKASSTTENNYTKQTVSSSAKKNNKGFELSAKKTPSSISSSKRTPLQMLSSNVAQRSLSTNLLASFENGGSSPYLARSNDANNRLPR